jgi:hypothetical protein
MCSHCILLLFVFGHVTICHRVDRVLSFYSSRWNWNSPTPSPAGSVPPAHPPFGSEGGGGHTRLRERGMGGGEDPKSDAAMYFLAIVIKQYPSDIFNKFFPDK